MTASGISNLSAPMVRFTLEDAKQANDEWGANCGPGALAAVAKLTLDEVRRHMAASDFERKGYTNPSMMFAALRSTGLKFHTAEFSQPVAWPKYGLARIQWEGRWTEPGVPIAARYRHTHWVGAALFEGRRLIFDINAMSVGGWIPSRQWAWHLVPWLLDQCEPKANGLWHVTHVIEVEER